MYIGGCPEAGSDANMDSASRQAAEGGDWTSCNGASAMDGSE